MKGNCLSGEFDGNGGAPDAKISFFDHTDDETGKTTTFTTDDLFQAQYDVGARVSTNSWALGDGYNYDASLPGFEYYAWRVDNFVFNHPDFFVLFAAANQGARGEGTIGDPAQAKNILTVGAGSMRLDPNDTYIPQMTVAFFSGLGPLSDGRYGIDVIGPGEVI